MGQGGRGSPAGVSCRGLDCRAGSEGSALLAHHLRQDKYHGGAKDAPAKQQIQHRVPDSSDHWNEGFNHGARYDSSSRLLSGRPPEIQPRTHAQAALRLFPTTQKLGKHPDGAKVALTFSSTNRSCHPLG